ncbi:MAG: RCC1 domain-containing protein [Polyangiaceae bacterium]
MSQRVLIVALCMLAVGCKSRAVVGIAAGKDNTCLRTEDGRVYCFGDDAYMQNKDPSFATRPGPRNSPKRVPGLDGVVDVAVAPSHACVANPSSGLRCFLDVDLEPASVSSFAAKQVVASLSGVCALGASGNVACYRAGARELPRDRSRCPRTSRRRRRSPPANGTSACWPRTAPSLAGETISSVSSARSTMRR